MPRKSNRSPVANRTRTGKRPSVKKFNNQGKTGKVMRGPDLGDKGGPDVVPQRRTS